MGAFISFQPIHPAEVGAEFAAFQPVKQIGHD